MLNKNTVFVLYVKGFAFVFYGAKATGFRKII